MTATDAIDKGEETDSDPRDWVTELCLTSDSTCPDDLLEEVMADPRCVPFGPIHHYIVGAVMLAAYRNAEASPDRDSRLAEDLAQLRERSACVPGAACARWGVCGAAASVGMAYAIVAENAPLRREGWSDGQLMVSRALERIARAGSPRCCKRDSRIAVDEAATTFAHDFGCALATPERRPVCRSMAFNSVCMGAACPYHPDHRTR